MTDLDDNRYSGDQMVDHAEQPVLAWGEYRLEKASSRPVITEDPWKIVVCLQAHLVSRRVSYQGHS